jgi:predicted GNAT family N-acyltransferase
MFGVDDPRMKEAIELRLAVFVDEQGIPLDEEIDAHDRDDSAAVHAIVRNSGTSVVATGRFYPRDVKTAQIGRMAVALAARGTGMGHVVLHALMNEARRRGFSAASLDAQEYAIGFYERAGFVCEGPTHLDCGIVHQPMRRELTA